jgi:hypothetical protein
MKTARIWLAGALCLPAALVLCYCCALPGRASPVKPPEKPADGGSTAPFTGSDSCGGRGCHGALSAQNDPPGVRRDEWSLWKRYDRHAQAYAVLLDGGTVHDRARRIADNLASTNKDGKRIPAYEDPRCLACHSTPALAAKKVDEAVTTMRSHGVGCEACHGPAGGTDGWLNLHYGKEWQATDRPERGEVRKKHHMTDTGDVREQVKMCVGCHIGAPAKGDEPARDLNHDLMAAGHPRLVFEFSAYLANMPPHWYPYPRDPKKANEAKLWAVGRVEAMSAALEQLASRAGAAEKDTVRWPEFAESDCFACHAGLHPGDSWRKREEHRKAGRRVGNLPFSTLYTTRLPEIADALGGTERTMRTSLDALAEEMQKPRPNANEVTKLAASARTFVDELSGKANAAKYDPNLIAKLIKALDADDKTLAAMSWDEVEQLVLALGALNEALPDAKKKDAKLFTPLYELLAYPRGFDSPESFRVHGGESGDNDKKLNDDLRALLKEFIPKP